jgi:mRNA interferase RelE/StbE
MSWTIDFDAHALKAFEKLDKTVKNRLERFLDGLEQSDNPRQQGKALNGKYKGLWRYRVGDYRMICNIQDNQLIILVLELGHRKEVYKN